MYTDIAITKSGYIGIYYSYQPEVKGGFLKPGVPEQPESFHVMHIDDITDFEFEYKETSIEQHRNDPRMCYTSINLILYTNDSNNPITTVTLYNGMFDGSGKHLPLVSKVDAPPPSYKAFVKEDGSIKRGSACVPDSIFVVFSRLYALGKVPYDRITELENVLNNMLDEKENQNAERENQNQSRLSVADEIIKFKSLLDTGVITQDEFDAKKRELLGGVPTQAAPVAQPTPVTQPEFVAQPAVSQQNRFCVNCGTQFNPNAAFCVKCGNKAQV